MADKAVRLHDLDYPLEAGQYVQNGIVYQAVTDRDLTPAVTDADLIEKAAQSQERAK